MRRPSARACPILVTGLVAVLLFGCASLGNREKEPPRPIHITGQVRSMESGLPLEGVRVEVEGTSVTSMTDTAGVYAVDAPDHRGTLVFFAEGYREQEQAIDGAAVVDAVLRKEDSDEEQVRVGYGTQARGDVTTSIATVSGEEADDRPVVRVEELLVGRVAGVQVYQTPGGDLAVRIRGAASLLGSSEPLYVVDGIPVLPGYGGALTGISPHDVASIEVLKDAGATAIYGSRGANGVIVVTTKRARRK